MNSNANLNSNTPNQCTSMYATLNSYDSFILFLKIIKCLKEIKKNLIVLNNTLKVANKFLNKIHFSQN
jgi:hypothetical protein